MTSLTAGRKTGHEVAILVLLVAFTLAIGWVGGSVTTPNIASWYNDLTKPSFTPPDWLFPPVWTVLYVVMAVAAWRVWRVRSWRTRGFALWLAQLALNFAWSFIFFGAHAPGPALAELMVLWVILFYTIVTFGRIDRPAGWMLIPYLGWVTFAGVLNYWIWQLNP